MDIEIGKLIGNIGLSVQKAQMAMEHNSEQTFLQYFDVEDMPVSSEQTGADTQNSLDTQEETVSGFAPKLYHFNMPQTDDTELLLVPTVALAKHSSLAIENIKIKLNVSGTVKNDRLYVNVESTSKEDNSSVPLVHEIEVEFKGTEANEGISRIVDSTNQFL